MNPSARPRTISWFFDFISPFAYLQFKRLQPEWANLPIVATPVLFAGLLKALDHKGPAEIPSKRRFTYRFAHWYAEQLQIPFQWPCAHPFNPLAALRLSIALGNDVNAIAQIFDFIWVDGRLTDAPHDREALASRLGVESLDELVTSAAVKGQLKENTESAISAGVFGVPTLMIGGEIFWGLDATDMALAYWRDPSDFETDEMRRISDLPVAAARAPT